MILENQVLEVCMKIKGGEPRVLMMAYQKVAMQGVLCNGGRIWNTNDCCGSRWYKISLSLWTPASHSSISQP